MDSLRITYNTLLKERVSTIRRGLLDKIDIRSRLIAVKGSRGVGKTNFLLDYSKEYFCDDATCLYVNINNLFFAKEGIFNFVKHFHQHGGKVLLLDQVHKCPDWDKELRACYDTFPDLQIVFTVSSTLRVKSNANLKDIVDMYNLSGLSFREFLELETGKKFPVYTFDEIINNHEEIAEKIIQSTHPLAHFGNYLRYGYYPIYLEEKSHIDYLLKNINLTLEFDIPYVNQIELKYLSKLKQLLYMAARDNSSSVNISKLSHEAGISRATVQNYLNYMRNARLLTLLYDEGDDMDCGKKPRKLYLHNSNLLNAVCLDDVDAQIVRKTFFLSQLCPINRISDSTKSDFMVDGKHEINICPEATKQKHNSNIITMDDGIELGKGNVIPLWLVGFIY